MLHDAADESHTGLARRPGDTLHVVPVTGPRKPVSGIIARNLQQTMALDLLLDDQVKFVTLLGLAGTGKTLVALAAGMTKTFSEERYEKLLCARPIMPMGRDIGYLPGDKDEKLTAWMQPIFDNLTYLLSTRGAPNQAPESHSSEQRINKLVADGTLVLGVAHLHPRPVDPAPVHARRRSAEPDAPRGQDHRQPRRRGHQARPHR
ncbi:MAG: PhoH family protein [Phycisphaerales bacterium]|nr:PhoH family protein [Phycisphaerales bacterium]